MSARTAPGNGASKERYGEIKDGVDFRRARLAASGALTDVTNYFFQMDFGFFGRPTFTYLDAGENSTRSYAAFLVKAPRDFRGVDRVLYGGGKLVIHELGGKRELAIQVDRLFQ
jgi:hypothetical protein